MFEAFLMVIGGFALLALGGEGLVMGAVSLAKSLNIPPLIIGLTFIAFGTSAPELMVSIQAAMNDNVGIAIGNVVGSNIANVLLVLGGAAIIAPLFAPATGLKRDSIVLLATTLGFIAVCFFGVVSLPIAVFMLACLIAYTVYAYLHEHSKKEISDIELEVQETRLKGGSAVALLVLCGGMAVLIYGSDILVQGAVTLAQNFGVSEAIIGLSIVAIGTSLPELAISVLAARRGHASVAIGNVIGSNLFNILLILGVAGTITPLHIDPQIIRFDVWVMLATTALMLWLLRPNAHISRLAGAGFLLAYFIYIAMLYGV